MTIDLWMLLAIFVASCGVVVFVLEEIKYKHMRRGFIAEIERLRRDPGARRPLRAVPADTLRQLWADADFMAETGRKRGEVSFDDLVTVLETVDPELPKPEPVNEMKGVPVNETEGGKLFTELSTGICPDCGGEGFWKGPSGGLSTNIYCCNAACRSAFNITPMVGTADRIGKAPDSCYQVREGDEKHQEVRASHKG